MWCQFDTLKEEREALNDEVFKILLQKWLSKINEIDETHEHLTPLALCCFTGIWSLAWVLVEFGADVNSVTETDMTPIKLCLLRRKEAEMRKDESMIVAMDQLIEYLKSKGGWEDWKTPTENVNQS